MCLPSHTGPQVKLGITYERGVEFPIETELICRRDFLSRTTQILMISRCYFAEEGEEMYTVLKHTCWAIVLVIRPFVLSRPRCRRRRALLKVPNIKQVPPRIRTPLPSSLTVFNIRDTRKSCFYFRFIYNFFKLQIQRNQYCLVVSFLETWVFLNFYHGSCILQVMLSLF